jgi:hypothetical protein
MDECAAASQAQGIHGQFGGGPLRPFFFRLAKLLKVPANFVFVFDGPKRPEKKRGKTVQQKKPLWWVAPAQALIHHYGFIVHEVSTSPILSLISIYSLERQWEKLRLSLQC